MQFDKWYHLLYISTDIPIRNPPSKHQAKVAEILYKIEDAKKMNNIGSLLETEFINSDYGNTEIISYCRYLQYMIRVLKDEGKQE